MAESLPETWSSMILLDWQSRDSRNMHFSAHTPHFPTGQSLVCATMPSFHVSAKETQDLMCGKHFLSWAISQPYPGNLLLISIMHIITPFWSFCQIFVHFSPVTVTHCFIHWLFLRCLRTRRNLGAYWRKVSSGKTHLSHPSVNAARTRQANTPQSVCWTHVGCSSVEI